MEETCRRSSGSWFGLLVLLSVVIALMLTGYALSTRIAAQDFDSEIAQAEPELKRLEFVLRRLEQVRVLRATLTLRGVGALPEPLPGEADPAIELLPAPPTPAFPGRAHLAQQRRYLDALHALIARGLVTERSLVDLERRLAELEGLLEEPTR